MLPTSSAGSAAQISRWTLPIATLLALAVGVGCSESPGAPGAETSSLQSDPPTVSFRTEQADSSVATAPPATEPRGDDTSTTESLTPTTDCEGTDQIIDLRGDTSEVIEVGTVDGVTVRAGLYPLPHDRGDPWSQWGQGVVLPSGRFVSAAGDHLGVDGNSWFYEYDPESSTLTRTADVSDALDHGTGDWGYGKIHAQMALDACGDIITSTYWGTRRGLVVGGSYSGDHLLRYDPATSKITSLGVPVTGFGIPSLAVSADGRYIFGEAVDPTSQPDAGSFFAADAATGEILFRSDDRRHVGFRSVLLGADGAAYFSAGGGRLFRYQPGSDDLTLASDELPGEWLRAASAVAPNGSVFAVTRQPDILFEMTPDGEIIDMGPTEGYVTSVALSPDGNTLYYVPDAHGEAWVDGTPLIAVDTTTGEHDVVVELNPLIESAFGVRAGGSYNVAVDPASGRVFVGLNASEVGSDDPETTFGSVVLAVVDLE